MPEAQRSSIERTTEGPALNSASLMLPHPGRALTPYALSTGEPRYSSPSHFGVASADIEAGTIAMATSLSRMPGLRLLNAQRALTHVADTWDRFRSR